MEELNKAINDIEINNLNIQHIMVSSQLYFEIVNMAVNRICIDKDPNDIICKYRGYELIRGNIYKDFCIMLKD